jgi:hypothetical protein
LLGSAEIGTGQGGEAGAAGTCASLIARF